MELLEELPKRKRAVSTCKVFTITELKGMATALYHLLTNHSEATNPLVPNGAMKNLKLVADQWYYNYATGNYIDGGDYGKAKLPDEILAKVEAMFKPKPKPRVKKVKLTAPVEMAVNLEPSPLLTDDDIPFRRD